MLLQFPSEAAIRETEKGVPHRLAEHPKCLQTGDFRRDRHTTPENHHEGMLMI